LIAGLNVALKSSLTAALSCPVYSPLTAALDPQLVA
jgi:hypothetical protein